MRLNIKVPIAPIFICGLIGCSEDSISQSLQEPSPARTVCREIADFRKSMEGLQASAIQEWSIGVSLSNALSAVRSQSGRIVLLKMVVKEISSMPYARIDAGKCRCLYASVAKAFAAVQDSAWKDADAPWLAIEFWFDEMNHFRNEVARCRKELACVGRNSESQTQELKDRILLCNSECEKTYYKIDIRGFMGESFCKRFPEKKDEFLERVKGIIGRYPEWHSER